MHARAPAKLNLYIHVHGRRDDGYHRIESGAVFTELGDTLHLEIADALTLQTHGPFAEAAGGGGGNLVLKAARALQEKTGTNKGALITLTKNIPVGAGLGGGSADAALALRLLNELWKLNLPKSELLALAPTLGADVAMCLDSMPVIATGIGEVLAPFPSALPPLYAVLAHPRVPLLTNDVYAALRREPLDEHAPVAWKNSSAFSAFIAQLARTRNDLQRPAIAVSAQVAQTLLALETNTPRAELVRMTGSGACCFALYATQQNAEAAAKNLRTDYPDWWVEATAVL